MKLETWLSIAAIEQGAHYLRKIFFKDQSMMKQALACDQASKG